MNSILECSWNHEYFGSFAKYIGHRLHTILIVSQNLSRFNRAVRKQPEHRFLFFSPQLILQLTEGVKFSKDQEVSNIFQGRGSNFFQGDPNANFYGNPYKLSFSRGLDPLFPLWIGTWETARGP